MIWHRRQIPLLHERECKPCNHEDMSSITDTFACNNQNILAMEKEIRTANVYNLIILDESGSMHSIYSQALSALNETLNGIRNTHAEYPHQHHFVSVITFEGQGMGAVKVRRDRIPVEKVEDMTEKDYRPGGCTPLYDAMGSAITSLSKVVSEGDAVLVTVITDGEENSSQEYSGTAVKSLVSQMREKGWTFAYIGANQDAVETARDLNIANALNYDATPEGTARMSVRWEKARKKFARKVQCCLEEGAAAPMASFRGIFEDDGNEEKE